MRSMAVVAYLLSGTFAMAGSDYPLTDTGQSTCFQLYDQVECPAPGEEFFGQDGQYESTPATFFDNKDGTVTDKVTELLWQRNPDDTRRSWSSAQAYCADLELAGRQDWRAPNIKELFGISDFSSGWPYLDREVFTLGGDGKDQQFWAKNFYFGGTTHGGAASAFGVNHSTGHIKAYPAERRERSEGQQPAGANPPPPPFSADNAAKPNGRPNFGKLVRCVAGAEVGANAFVDNGDGTITDAATGLMWAQNDAGSDMDWQDALHYAETAVLAGYDDWRLPNVRELQSIVDYSGVFPAIDAEYFQWTEADRYFWTSTSAYHGPSAPDHFYAWYVAFGYAPGPDGEDVHGAGAVRFIGKSEDSPAAEGDYRPFNAVRLVRNVN